MEITVLEQTIPKVEQPEFDILLEQLEKDGTIPSDVYFYMRTIEDKKPMTIELDTNLNGINIEKLAKLNQVYPIIEKKPSVSAEDLIDEYEKYHGEITTGGVSSTNDDTGYHTEQVYFSDSVNCMYFEDIPTIHSIWNQTKDIIGICIDPRKDIMRIYDTSILYNMEPMDYLLSHTYSYMVEMLLANTSLPIHPIDGYYIIYFKDENQTDKLLTILINYYNNALQFHNSIFAKYSAIIARNHTNMEYYDNDIVHKSLVYNYIEQLSKNTKDYITEIDKLYHGKTGTKYEASMYYDLLNLPPISDRKKIIVEYNHNYEIIKQKFKEGYHNNEVIYHYIQKFGMNKYRKCRSDTKIFSNMLDDKILSSIEKTIEKNHIFVKNLKNMNLDFMEDVEALHKTMEENLKKKIYYELKNKLNLKKMPPDANEMHTVDGVKVICPHLINKMEAMINREQDNIIEDYGVKTNNMIFCRICGDKIYDIVETDISYDMEYMLEGYDDDMRKYIWSIIGFIVRSSIEFNPPRSSGSKNKFITDMTKRLMPYISDIDKKLMKSKTMAEEEYESNKTIYTNIYAYALLSHVIGDNYKIMRFKDNRFKFSMRPKISELAGYVANMMYKKLKNYLMIINMDDKTFKLVIKQAFGEMNRADSMIINQEESSLFQFLVTDTIYRILFLDNFFHMNIDKNNRLKAYLEAGKLENTLRESFDNLEKLDFLYQKIEMKTKPPEFSIENVIKGNNTYSFMSEINKIFMLHAMKHTIEYTRSRLYMKDMWKTEIIDGNLVKEMNKEYQEFIEPYKKLNHMEEEISRLFKYTFKRSRYFGPANKSHAYNNYFNIVGYWARSYGNQANKKYNKDAKSGFHKHKWSLNAYVEMEKFNGYSIYKYKPSIVAIRNKMEPSEVHIDNICSICYHGWFTYYEMTDAYSIMEKNFMIENFYNLYSYRCPEDKAPFHEFVNNKCKYCSVDKQMIENMDKSYYEKYKNKMKKEKNVVMVGIDWKMTYEENGKFNENNFTNLPQILIHKSYNQSQITNIVKNLGLNSGYYRDQVINGINVEQNHRKQIHNINEHINLLLTKIEIIIHYNNLSKPPLWAKKIMEEFDKKTMDKIHTIHPDISKMNMKINKNDTYYTIRKRLMHDNKGLLSFTKAYIGNLMRHLKDTAGKIHEDLFKYFSELLINMELDMATPDIKQSINDASQVSNLKLEDMGTDSSQLQDLDELVEGKKYDFGYEDMDYEGENDEGAI